MKNLKSLVFICSIMLFSSFVFAQYDKLSLSFEKEEAWCFAAPRQVLYRDTVDVIDGKYSMRIVDTSTRAFPIPSYFFGNIFQYIQMPVDSPEIELSVYAKSERIDEARIKLYRLDEGGKLLFRDSLSILSPYEWKKFRLVIPHSRAQQVFLEIAMQRKHLVTDKKEKVLSSLLVDNVQIKVNGKDITTYHEPKFKVALSDSIKICSHVKITQGQPLNIDSLPDFKGHRILAFGETVHTSGEVQQFVYGAIQRLIEKNNCRLILLEFPYEMSLRLNAYVNGETNIDVSELLFFSLRDTAKILPFLRWVRNFNLKSSSKVNLIGVDVEPPLSKFYDNLYRLVENDIPRSRAFSMFKLSLRSAKYNDALRLMTDKPDSLELELGHSRYLVLRRALQLQQEQNAPDFNMFGPDRDYAMYQNAKWAIDNYLRNGEQAVVYTHLGHANTGNVFYLRYNTPSMGTYMKTNYGMGYFVIAVAIGSGTITDPDNMRSGVGLPIVSNETGSLEHLCMLSPDKCFYKNLNDIGVTSFVRAIGNQGPNDIFWPFSHQGKVDGVVFIRESTHYKRPNGWPDTIVEYMDKYWIPRKNEYKAAEKQTVGP